MKNLQLILIAMIAVITASCQNKNAYSISGTIDMPDSTYVYLNEFTLVHHEGFRMLKKIDSTIVLGGKFEMKGITDQSEFRLLGTDRLNEASIVVEPGTIIVDFVKKKVSGTPLNDSIQALSDNQKAAKERVFQKYNDFNTFLAENYAGVKKLPEVLPADMQVYQDEIDKALAEESNIIKKFVINNINNIAGQYIFLQEIKLFDNDDQREKLGKLNSNLHGTVYVKAMQERADAFFNTSLGKNFVDVKGKDPKGKDIKLSDFAGKGKVVLVDFWASWCVPCVAEMPELVKMYEKYNKNGFEIVGVSFDDNQEKWEKGIEKSNLTWPHISDLKGWKSEAVKSYVITGIPYTVLIDKDGTIIAKGRFEIKELEEKVTEALK